jgi:diaminopimelate decarboxylase
MNNHFTHNNQEWFVESLSLHAIAKQFGTPCYVYSKAAILENWYTFDKAFNNYPHQINYAVKANSNIAILNLLTTLGSGFDIVSIGELERVLVTKCLPEKIVFSGVGKTTQELSYALRAKVGCINVESKSELMRLNNIAVNLTIKANIAIRINPNVDAKSHPYISTGLKENKFGVSINEAKELYLIASQLPGIKIKGISFHIGSQITSLTPFLQAIDQILGLIADLRKIDITLEHINVGGGLGVVYQDELIPSIQEYILAIINKLKSTNLAVHIEPGRAMVANTGILLTRVEYIKKFSSDDNSKRQYFAIVDAGMNDLFRPALYDAWHNIINVNIKPKQASISKYDIVGPVCETGDFLGKNRDLSLEEGDLLMVCTAGAYGFSMSSNYNSRPKAAEIMVDGDQFKVIRERESLQELFKLERL